MAKTRLGLPFSGARLRDWRERSGLTQRELGETCGLSRYQISRWETGSTRPAPGALKPLVAGLADALNRPIAGENPFTLADLLELETDVDPQTGRGSTSATGF